jgi:SagB-type dehydrogenase family enzyme
MKSAAVTILCIVTLFCVCAANAQNPKTETGAVKPQTGEQLVLGEPNFVSKMTAEQAISQQKQAAGFQGVELEGIELRQLAWAGQNVIKSISTLAPPENSISMELYLCLFSGVYHYNATSGTLDSLLVTDVRSAIGAAAHNEAAFEQAPCTIIITGSYKPTAQVVREQARNFMILQAGRISQNIAIEAQCLGLGSLGIGAFDLARVKRVARLPQPQEPIYMIAVGHPAVVITKQTSMGSKPPAVLFVVSGSDPITTYVSLIDFFHEAGVKTSMAQIGASMYTYDQPPIKPDVLIQNVVVTDYNAIVIAGGGANPSFTGSVPLLNIIRTAKRQGVVVGAMGDSITVLIKAGVLVGVRVTGDQRTLMNTGGIYTGNYVESDRGVVTALNDQQAGLFARAIIAAIKGRPFTPPQTPPTQPGTIPTTTIKKY